MATMTTEGVVGGRLGAGGLRQEFRRPDAAADASTRPSSNRRGATSATTRPAFRPVPTSIDIPLFIRQIGAGNDLGAAETILSANILGGMCARVCPTEELCEEACVREHAEGKPVKIGALQRHATDALMQTGQHPFVRQAPTGRRGRGGRGRPGGPLLRASAGRARPRGDAVRCPAEARRPQRIWHRGLQDAGRFRAIRGGFHPRHRRHRGEAGRRSSAPTSISPPCASSSTRCSSAWASAGSTRSRACATMPT